MDDKILLTFLGILFLVLQFFMTMTNRKWTREILAQLSIGTSHFDSQYAAQDKQLKEIKKNTALIGTIVERTDEDGSPLVYAPRSWATAQKEIAQICSDNAHVQKAIVKILERIDLRQDSRRSEFEG